MTTERIPKEIRNQKNPRPDLKIARADFQTALPAPSQLTPKTIHQLQRAIGNQAVQHLLPVQMQGPPASLGGLAAASVLQRQPEDKGAESSTAENVAQGVGNVSVYAGITMTSESALRLIYQKGAHEISEEALRMVSKGSTVEEAARWAVTARNDLKVAIRARGSDIVKGFAEARNLRVYGNKTGPTFEQLIREGKTPEDIIESAGKASPKVNRLASRLKVGGRFLIALDIAIVTWEVWSAPEGQKLKAGVSGAAGIGGAAAGGWAGAKGGAAVGAFFGGPIGAGIGGVLGGIGGALFGGWLGHKAGEEAYDLVDELVNPQDMNAAIEEGMINGIEDSYIRSHAGKP